MTAIQKNDAGENAVYPIFADMNGERGLRNTEYFLQWLIADIDGDSAVEMVFLVDTHDSLYSFYEGYKIEGGKPMKKFHIGLG